MRIPLVTVAALALVLPSAAFAKPKPPVGTTTVLATVPAPGYPGPMGFPEGLAVNGNKAYVGTSATFGTAGSVASRVYAFDRKSGALSRTYVIQGQDLSQEHALSNLAFDDDDRLYVLDTQQGVIRLELGSGDQEVYAPIPDLLPCSVALAGTDCSPTLFDRTPLPNDIVFAEDGTAYVTDSFQATIWRIPAGGGYAEVWFQDPVLDDLFGPNGIRLSPDRSELVFAQTLTGFDFGTPGFIYSLPLVDQPTSADLSVFHTYGFESPDGIAFGASGNLYVALALTNQISVLAPDGSELTRYSGPASSPSGPIPFDAPASVAFDNASKSLLVTNHPLFSGIPQNFALIGVVVNDTADPLERPELD